MYKNSNNALHTYTAVHFSTETPAS